MGYSRYYPYPEIDNPWDEKCFAYLKPIIKNKLVQTYHPRSSRCSYCRRYFGLNGDNINIDIEHILPKNKYKEYTFFLPNLTLACKRCNMTIKGNRIDFLKIKKGDPKYKTELDFDKNNYKFLHPKLEDISEYLNYKRDETDEYCVLFYNKTDKGLGDDRVDYMIDFFKLKELEIDSREVFQGNIKNLEIQRKLNIPDEY